MSKFNKAVSLLHSVVNANNPGVFSIPDNTNLYFSIRGRKHIRVGVQSHYYEGFNMYYDIEYTSYGEHPYSYIMDFAEVHRLCKFYMKNRKQTKSDTCAFNFDFNGVCVVKSLRNDGEGFVDGVCGGVDTQLRCDKTTDTDFDNVFNIKDDYKDIFITGAELFDHLSALQFSCAGNRVQNGLKITGSSDDYKVEMESYCSYGIYNTLFENRLVKDDFEFIIYRGIFHAMKKMNKTELVKNVDIKFGKNYLLIKSARYRMNIPLVHLQIEFHVNIGNEIASITNIHKNQFEPITNVKPKYSKLFGVGNKHKEHKSIVNFKRKDGYLHITLFDDRYDDNGNERDKHGNPVLNGKKGKFVIFSKCYGKLDGYDVCVNYSHDIFNALMSCFDKRDSIHISFKELTGQTILVIDNECGNDYKTKTFLLMPLR